VDKEATIRDPRSTHPKLARALERLGSTDLSGDCAASAPAELIQAIAEFNAGEFFEQHETLEDAWIAETDPIRYLYQGILQVGVGLYHLGRGNLYGADRLMTRGLVLLQAFRPSCMGVDVDRFVEESLRCLEAVRRLTPATIDAFDRSLIPRVEFVAST
jgi:uncharacterized protein